MTDDQGTNRSPAATLGGQHPHDRAKQNELSLLLYLLVWGWSSARVLQDYLVTTATPRLIQRLLERHEIRRVDIWSLPRTPAFMLTELGLQRVSVSTTRNQEIADYAWGPGAMVRPALARHHLALQRAMLLQGVPLAHLSPDRYWSAESQAGIKRPDCLVARADGTIEAIEMELTAKKGRELDQVFWRHMTCIAKGHYQEVIYVSPIRWLLSNYRAVLHDRDGLKLWAKNPRGIWAVTQRRKANQQQLDAFEWLHDRRVLEGLA